MGRAAADPVFVSTAACKEVIYPATLCRVLQLAIRLFFLSAAFKRGRTVNCLL